jgi:hypothetical protein
VSDADTDADGLTNSEESTLGTNANNADSDGDGLTDKQEAELGTNPNLADTDDDHFDDGDDAEPNDSEINWPKTPESKYVWVEQMVLPTDSEGNPIAPVAVNSLGQILFPRFTGSESGPGGNTPKDALWSSAKKSWETLNPGGSQKVNVKLNSPPSEQTLSAIAEHFIDINDHGTVVGVTGHNAHFDDPSGSATLNDLMTYGMVWKNSGLPNNQYAPPQYFFKDEPVDLGIFPTLGQAAVTSERPLVAIANDGSVNALFHYAAPPAPGLHTDWSIHDSASENTYSTEIKTFPHGYNSTSDRIESGTILDKDRALFAESVHPQQGPPQHHLWLKDGTAISDLAFMVPDGLDLAEMSLAPNLKNDQKERLWITTREKVYLEKRTGGTGQARWHNLTDSEPNTNKEKSMAEGAIRLNARGEAITSGDFTFGQYFIPPKIWRNGKYTNLNNITFKPGSVEIKRAIDLASNGIILVTATDGGVNKTGLLIPMEVRGYATKESEQHDSYVGRVNNQNVYESHREKIPDTSDHTTFKTEVKNKLKIAQWGDPALFDDALNFVHAEFKQDLDIFRVRLPGLPIPTGIAEHRVKISTTDKSGAVLDPGAYVDLDIILTNPHDPASPIKFHETPALALVVDDPTDDGFEVEGKVDGSKPGIVPEDHPGDRTYRAVLGGTVKIEWTTAPGAGPKPVIEIPVPAERVVRVQPFVLKGTGGTPTAWFSRAKKIYSAAAVDLIFQEPVSIDPLPAGVDLDQFDLPTETAGYLHEMMDETIALMDFRDCKVDPDVIPVFIVNQLNPRVAGATNVPSYMVAGEEKYGGAIFINSGHEKESVLAHELAHALLDAQHYPSTNKLWNDYFSDTREKTNIWWGDISDAKGTWWETEIKAHRRLTDSMRSRIWKSRFAKIPTP